MKLSSIKIGCVYQARVDGHEEPVLVNSISKVWDCGSYRTVIHVTLDDISGTRTTVSPRAIMHEVDYTNR